MPVALSERGSRHGLFGPLLVGVLGLNLALVPAPVRAQFPKFIEIAPIAGDMLYATRDPILLEDLDGDGRLNLVVMRADEMLVFRILDRGAPLPQRFAVGNGKPVSYGLVAADINADGRPDIVASTTDGIVVLVNTTPEDSRVLSFAAPAPFTAPMPFHLAAADLNGDGRLDIVATSDFGLQVHLNSTVAGATVPTFLPVQYIADVQSLFLATADFNADGRIDVVVGQAARLRLWLNETTPGSDLMAWADPLPLPAGFTPGYIAIADFNTDGRPDIAVGSTFYLPERVLGFVNDTPPGATAASFGTAQPLGLATKVSPRLRAADLDGDGRVDLILANDCCNPADALMFQINDTSPGAQTLDFRPPQFITQQSHPHAPIAHDVQLADVNGDGRIDLVGKFSLVVRVMLNLARNDVVFRSDFQ